MATKDDNVEVTFTDAEFEALKHLVVFAIEAEAVREPYPAEVEGVLRKLDLGKLREEDPDAAARARRPEPDRLPTKAQ